MSRIFTIGTGGLRMGEFVSILEQEGVTVIVDVRTRPYGWNKDFHRENLRSVYYPGYRWAGRILGGFTVEEEYGSDNWRAAIDKIIGLSESETVVILCSEENPEECHRSKIAGDIENEGYEVVHLRHGDYIERLKGKAKEKTKADGQQLKLGDFCT